MNLPSKKGTFGRTEELTFCEDIATLAGQRSTGAEHYSLVIKLPESGEGGTDSVRDFRVVDSGGMASAKSQLEPLAFKKKVQLGTHSITLNETALDVGSPLPFLVPPNPNIKGASAFRSPHRAVRWQ